MSTVADYQNMIIADAPLLYWPLNDGGTTADDFSGNGRHGTLGTAALWTPAPVATRRGDYCFVCNAASGNAISYTGTMDTLNAVGLSVEFWIYQATVSGSALYPYIHGLGGWSEFGGIGATSGGFNIGTNLASRLSTTLSATTWTHIVFTQEPDGTSRLYKNNSLVDGPTVKTRPTQDMTGFCIDNGGTNHTDYWQHVAVYDKVLTATDVADRYTMAMDQNSTVINYPVMMSPRTVINAPYNRVPYMQPARQRWPIGVYVPEDVDGNDLDGELDGDA